jgi:predicted molibdopterin-dependent oxidoreductase YjgC
MRARGRGSQLIVVDVRESEVARIASVFVRLWRLGLGYALLNCMVKAVVLKELYSRSFAEKRTEGFEEFVKSLELYTSTFCEELLKCKDFFAKECEGCRYKAFESTLSTATA